jgi:hypothetical protein
LGEEGGNEYQELADADEAFSDASFENFGLFNVFRGGLFALFKVDVFRHDVCGGSTFSGRAG